MKTLPQMSKILAASRLIVIALSAVIISLSAPAQVPRIDSVNPGAATVGSAITISGANFSPTPGNNIVYFGAVRATVTSASGNALTAIVPTSASYAPVTVTVNGLTAFAKTPFDVTFTGGGTIDFAPLVAIDGGTGVSLVGSFTPVGPWVAIGDLDGDGKPEIVFFDQNGIVQVLRNTSIAGTLDENSFVREPEPGGTGLSISFSVTMADIDGDGKLDLVVGGAFDGGEIGFSVLRNTSVPGAITFAPGVGFSDHPHGAPIAVAIQDFDGDGKPDILRSGTVSPNTSTIGNIAFGPSIPVSSPSRSPATR